YPYGFRLRTTLYDTVEFSPKKGFRRVTQTVNPKTGKLNKPKKSTYSALLFRYKDENGHIKSVVHNFNGGVDKTNKVSQFLKDNFSLFTSEEREYVYQHLLLDLKLSMRGSVIYSGAKLEDLKPLFNDFVDAMVQGLKDVDTNYFGMQLDAEGIDKTKDSDYKPFR